MDSLLARAQCLILDKVWVKFTAMVNQIVVCKRDSICKLVLNKHPEWVSNVKVFSVRLMHLHHSTTFKDLNLRIVRLPEIVRVHLVHRMFALLRVMAE